MGNSFGRLCSGSRFKEKKKRYITANDERLRLKDGEGNSEIIEDFDKENIEDTDKLKGKSKMVVPRLHDGYMTVNEFKKCMSFLSQPDVEIPDSTAALEKPDVIYGFITDVENADAAAMKEQSEIVFTDTDESTELMNEVIDGVYESEQHQMQTLELKNTRRNSGQSESSTDSGQSSSKSSSSETRRKQSRSDSYLCSSNCSKCRAVYMEYMVEVYKQLIVRQIKVIDILDFLNVLDDRSKEMLRSKHIQSPHGAMELLIDIIKRSHAPGKWQCLYDAIDASEFTYISMLLKEETENQYDYSTDVLELVKPEIKSRIYLPDFLDKVFERQLVTEAEKDEANSFSDLEAKIFILDRIDKHLPNWNNVLVEVLNDSFMDDLAALFILVSRNNDDCTPKPKGCDIRSYRRALRRRRKHIMKIAHGNTNYEATSSFQAHQLSSLNNDVRGETVAISEFGMILEKSVTDLTTTIDELKIRLRNSESEVDTTLLQDLIREQNRLNSQQEYICSEIGNIRKDMSDMKELLVSVAR